MLSRIHPQFDPSKCSWAPFACYLNSRSVQFYDKKSFECAKDLEKQFSLLSPRGNQFSPIGKEIFIFDYTWDKLSNEHDCLEYHLYPEEYPKMDSMSHRLFKIDFGAQVGLDPKDIITLYDTNFYETLPGLALASAHETACLFWVAISVDLNHSYDLLSSAVQKERRYDSGPDDLLFVSLSPFESLFSGWHVRQTRCKALQIDGIKDGTVHLRHSQQIPLLQHSPLLNSILNKRGQITIKESVPQAQIMHDVYRKVHQQTDREFYQIGLGPAQLSLDLLLSHYEVRLHQLLYEDQRSFTLSILHSNHTFIKQLQENPSLHARLMRLLSRCIEKDADYLHLLNHRERFFFCCEILWSIKAISETDEKWKQTIQLIKAPLTVLTNTSDTAQNAAPLWSLFFHKDLGIDPIKALFDYGTFSSHDICKLYIREQAAQMACDIGKQACQSLQNPQERNHLLSKVLTKEEMDMASSLECKNYKKEWTCLAKHGTKIREKQALETHLLETDAYRKSLPYQIPWEEEATQKYLKEVEVSLSNLSASIDQEVDKISQQRPALLQIMYRTLLIYQNHIVQIDWDRGLVFRNGKTESKARLPEHIRRHPCLDPFLDIRNGPMQMAKKGYIPLQYPNLRIDPEEKRVYLTYKDKEYRVLDKKEKKQIILPYALSQEFTIWQSLEDFLLCLHTDVGKPIPCFVITKEGSIHPIDQKEYALLEEKKDPKYKVFTRLGFQWDEILIWDFGQIIDLPISYKDKPFLRFIEGKIEGTDLHLVDRTHSLPKSLTQPFSIRLQDSAGKQYEMFNPRPIEELQKRLYHHERYGSWKTVLQQKGKEKVLVCALDENERLQPAKSEEALYVAYFYFCSCELLNSAHLLRRWIRPIGRAYTHQELRIIGYLIRPFSKDWKICDAKKASRPKDLHPERAAIRLYAAYQVYKHLLEYPIEADVLDKEAKLPYKLLFGQYKHTSYMQRHLQEMYVAATQVKELHHTCKLEALFKPYEEEELLRLIGDDALTPGILRLQQRLPIYGDTKEVQWGSLMRLKGHVENEGLSNITYQKKNTDLNFDEMARELFEWSEQRDTIPIEELKALTVPVSPLPFFCHAYHLLRFGPDNEEKKALKQYIQDFRKGRPYVSYYSDWSRIGILHHPQRNDIFTWILFEQMILWIEKGNTPKDLPEMPILTKSFGMISKKEQETFTTFIQSLAEAMEISLPDLANQWGKEQVSHSSVSMIKQSVALKYPKQIADDLKASRPASLASAIEDWKLYGAQQNLSAPIFSEIAAEELEVFAEWKSVQEMSLARDDLQRKMQQAKEDLLSEANRLPTSSLQASYKEAARQDSVALSRKVEDCIGLAIIGEEKLWQESCPFGNPTKLQTLTTQYAIYLTEWQHISRCIDQGAITEGSRTYPITRENFILLAKEALANIRLRTDQYVTQELLDAKHSRAIKLIMGAGKTSVLAPVLMARHRGVFCVPNALFDTTIQLFQKILTEKLGRSFDIFTFNRENCTEDQLWVLADKLRRNEEDGVVLLTRPRDLHAFQLMLKERHELIREMQSRFDRFYRSWESQNVKNKEEDQAKWNVARKQLQEECVHLMREADLLQAMLHRMRKGMYGLFDEIMSANDPHNLLCFPMGWQLNANAQAIELAADMYFTWLPEHDKHLQFLSNQQNHSSIEDRKKVYHQIALKAWESYRDDLQKVSHEKAFIEYVFSKSTKESKQLESTLEQWNEGSFLPHKHLAQKIAFLKFCLSYGLEGSLSSVAHVNYGRSLQDKSLGLVIPYESEGEPKENTMYKKPWETLLKSCQYYLQCWKDPSQTRELIEMCSVLLESNELQQAPYLIDLLFEQPVGNIDLNDKALLEQISQDIDRALKEQTEKGRAARLIVRHWFVTRLAPVQLRLDPYQMSSNPQSLMRVTKQANGFGGTWPFSQTWPRHLEQYPDEQTDEKIAEIMRQPQNQCCHLLKTAKGEELIKEIASHCHDNISAILDVGAFLKGFSRKYLARMLMQCLPDRKGILYFEKSKEGKRTLMLRTKQGEQTLGMPEPSALQQQLESQGIVHPIMIYDQAACLGQNWIQKAGGLLCFSKLVTRDEYFQAAMRLRGLIKGNNHIETLIPREMQDANPWNVERVLAKTQQTKEEKERNANFAGIISQIKGHAFGVADDYMRAMTDAKKRQDYWDSIYDKIMERQENDLFKEFGQISCPKDPWEIIEQQIDHLPILTIVQGSQEKYLKVKKELREIVEYHRANNIKLPKEISEGKEAFGAAQEVNLSRDRQQMQEEEYERMLGSRVPIVEKPWTIMHRQNIKASLMGQITNTEGMPTLYTLNDALADRGFPPVFSQEILVTENLIRTFRGQTNCLLTEDQKTIHHCLVCRLSNDVYRLVLVSEEEAEAVKTLLLPGMWLYQPEGFLCQSGNGHHPPLHKSRVESLLAQALIFQGNALHIEQGSESMRNKIEEWLATETEIKTEIFRYAISCRSDDLAAYQQSSLLYKLFQKSLTSTGSAC